MRSDINGHWDELSLPFLDFGFYMVLSNKIFILFLFILNK
jgi:hypothetical protein